MSIELEHNFIIHYVYECWFLFHRERRQSTEHRMLLFHCLIINKVDKILRFIGDVIKSLEFYC